MEWEESHYSWEVVDTRWFLGEHGQVFFFFFFFSTSHSVASDKLFLVEKMALNTNSDSTNQTTENMKLRTNSRE